MFRKSRMPISLAALSIRFGPSSTVLLDAKLGPLTVAKLSSTTRVGSWLQQMLWLLVQLLCGGDLLTVLGRRRWLAYRKDDGVAH